MCNKDHKCDNCGKSTFTSSCYTTFGKFCSSECADEFVNKTPNIICFCCNKKVMKDDIYLTIDGHFFCDGSCIVDFIDSAKKRIKEMEMEEIKIDIDNRQLKARNEWLEKRHKELMIERKFIRRMLK